MRLGARILKFTCLLTVLMVGFGLVGGASLAGEEGKPFTAEELQTRVVDHTLFTGGGKGENKWRSYYYLHPDGTAVGKAWGEGWKFGATGTWKIVGDTICSEWSNPNWGKACYIYFEKGKVTAQV